MGVVTHTRLHTGYGEDFQAQLLALGAIGGGLAGVLLNAFLSSAR